jgi:cytochrome b pre-mRNA-processing protein 3
MKLAALFSSKPRVSPVHALYAALVEESRAPEFYERWGVPDTLDGRFEVISLHAFLVLRRLKESKSAAGFAQDFFDLMFRDFDRNLREMGASDLGVGRQVKTMARAFYGRIRAYERGLDGDEDLAQALKRNLYGTATPDAAQLAAMADYVRRRAAALATTPVETLLAGEFPPVRMGA